MNIPLHVQASRPLSRRRPAKSTLALAIATVLASAGLPAASWAQGRQQTIALQGQSAPGVAGGSFGSFEAAVLNDAGQTAFRAQLAGAGAAQGIYRSGPGSLLTPMALQGQSAPGTGGSYAGLTNPLLNNVGQLAFYADVAGSPNPGGIFASSSAGAVSAAVLVGQPVGGVVTIGSLRAPAAFNDAGQIAFRANVSQSGSSFSSIYLSGSGGPTQIAHFGQTAPQLGGGWLKAFDEPVIGPAGQVAFSAAVQMFQAPDSQGLYRGSGGTLTPLAVVGQAAPGTGGTFGGFDPLRAFNGNGQVAFRATIAGGTSSNAVYRSDVGSAALTALAWQGQAAPGSGGGFFTVLGAPLLNDAGQAAFSAGLAGGAGNQAIYRSSSDTALTPIALEGQVAPGAGGATFRKLDFDLFLNAGGQVAFTAGLSGGAGENGVFIGDGRDLLAVQLEGAALAGKTVDSLALSAQPLNQHGQVAYTATFTDGQTGVFVYTPGLRWRESFSGSWDNASAWTLGLRPGVVHDVAIDPSSSLTITGPSGTTNLRSLTVGGGSGFATLQLAGGTLAAATPVQIAARGILGGDGTITAQVVNAGEVRADNLILPGGLLNQGTVRGSAGGHQRIDTNLFNTASGIVRADAGDVLRINGSTHSNSGRIEVRGGEMQWAASGGFNNFGRIEVRGGGDLLVAANSFGNYGQLQIDSASARFAATMQTNHGGASISLNDASVAFDSPLVNQGELRVTFGESQFIGRIRNEAGGKIILTGHSNTTFHDAVEVGSGAELRVSAGAAAVFFDKVYQRTGSLFTGSGTKFYEGGLSVGDSPGLGTDAGDVHFGAANVYLAEIGGLAAGTGFDKYIVAGHLAFGGTLQLAWWDGFQGLPGQTFDLFDWGSSSGSFAAIDFGSATLADGLAWDTSRLYAAGEISITAVPEPGIWLLMAAGLAGLGWRTRRLASAREGA